jgi:Trk-type K+ transport system membrane component
MSHILMIKIIGVTLVVAIALYLLVNSMARNMSPEEQIYYSMARELPKDVKVMAFINGTVWIALFVEIVVTIFSW